MEDKICNLQNKNALKEIRASTTQRLVTPILMTLKTLIK